MSRRRPRAAPRGPAGRRDARGRAARRARRGLRASRRAGRPRRRRGPSRRSPRAAPRAPSAPARQPAAETPPPGSARRARAARRGPRGRRSLRPPGRARASCSLHRRGMLRAGGRPGQGVARRPVEAVARRPVTELLRASQARDSRRVRARPEQRPGPPLARPPQRRPPVRRLPPTLPAVGRPARPLLRTRARGRRPRADELRTLERLLHRPHREEAPEPLPAGHARALLRHRGLQPLLPLLPELGHLEEPRARTALRRGAARAHRRRRARARRAERRLHLQRSGDLPRVRDRDRARVPDRGNPERGGDGRLRGPGAARRAVRRDGRGERRSQGLHRVVLQEGLRREPRAGLGDARVPPRRDLGVARGDDAPDPGRERRRRRAPRRERVVRRDARARRALALHRFPSRLPHARQAAHAGNHADACACDRALLRTPSRLHRQRPRRGRREHLLCRAAANG